MAAAPIGRDLESGMLWNPRLSCGQPRVSIVSGPALIYITQNFSAPTNMQTELQQLST